MQRQISFQESRGGCAVYASEPELVSGIRTS